MGRPKLDNPRTHITVRLDPEVYYIITRLAETEDISIGKAIDKIVNDYCRLVDSIQQM